MSNASSKHGSPAARAGSTPHAPSHAPTAVLVGEAPGDLLAWWYATVAQAWPAAGLTPCPAPRTFTLEDVCLRADTAERLAAAAVVVFRCTATTKAPLLLRAAGVLAEAGAVGVAIVPAELSAITDRLASSGLLVMGEETPASLLTGSLLALAHRRPALAELDRELRHAWRAQQSARDWIRRVDEELHLAACVQQECLPRTLPDVHGLDMGVLFRPLWHVSGDIYRVSRLDESRVGFFIADAMGHGLSAAMFTMILAHSLPTKDITSSAYRIVPPAEALSRLNAELLRFDVRGQTARFASAVYGVLDTAGHTVRLAIGGHPPPLRITAKGNVEAYDTAGPILGVFPQPEFPELSFALEPGDTLALFTDGLEEVLFNHPGIGHEPTTGASHPIAPWLAPRGGQDTVARCIERLREHLDNCPGSLHRTDDLTVLALRATPGA